MNLKISLDWSAFNEPFHKLRFMNFNFYISYYHFCDSSNPLVYLGNHKLDFFIGTDEDRYK